jgi:hypothetical protein
MARLAGRGVFHTLCAQTGALQDRSRPNDVLRGLIHARLRGRAYHGGSESRIAQYHAMIQDGTGGLSCQSNAVRGPGRRPCARD